MAIWIELRCERRGEGRNPYSGTRCWSDDNNGPAEAAGDNNSEIIETYRFLKKVALAEGWKHIRSEGWVCPNCLAYSDKRGGDHD